MYCRMTVRETERLHARILWLEQRLQERENIISLLSDEVFSMRYGRASGLTHEGATDGFDRCETEPCSDDG